MSSTKEIYWVCKQANQDFWQKIQLLQKYHVSVRVLPDCPSLMRAYGETRLTTVIISDDEDEQQLESYMLRLSNHPEYAGVRFILALSRWRPRLVQKAVDLGFRDILPIDLPDAQWLRRYAFASSGRPTELSDSHPQMSMRAIASVQVPGRIAWVTDRQLWLETRLSPQVGQELMLSGGFADLLGVKQVQLKVQARHRSHLHFRYSEALLCQWSVKGGQTLNTEALKSFLREQADASSYRFYAVVRNKDIRNALVKRLPQERFQVTVALNKNNMVQEPRFIAPDAILIEDKMCVGSYQASFDEMLASLDPKVPVFILGDSARSVSSKAANRLIPVPEMPKDLGGYFETELGSPQRIQADATYVPKTHSVSFASIQVGARILSLHPERMELATALPLGRFGLFSVDAPIFQSTLKGKAHGKVIQQDALDHGPLMKEFPFHITTLLVDIPYEGRELLADHLITLFAQQLRPSGHQAMLPIGSKPLAAADKSMTEIADSIEPMVEPAIPYPMIDAVQGAGPMRTEIAKPLRDIGPSEPVIHPTTETEVVPLTQAIRADVRYNDNRLSDWLDAFVDLLRGIPHEIYVMLLVVLGLAIAVGAGFFLRSPEENQGKVFSEQLKIFSEQHGGGRPAPRAPENDFAPEE